MAPDGAIESKAVFIVEHRKHLMRKERGIFVGTDNRALTGG